MKITLQHLQEMLWKIAILLLFKSFLFSQDLHDFKYVPGLLEKGLSEIRTERNALKITPTLDIPLKLAFVERLLQNPLSAPEILTDLTNRCYKVKTSSEIIKIAAKLLGVPELREYFKGLNFYSTGKFIESLSETIKKAKSLLNTSVNSLTEKQRKDIKEIIYNITTNGWNSYISTESEAVGISQNMWKSEIFKSMEDFDMRSLLEASYLLTQMCDEIISQFHKIQDLIKKRKRFKTSVGDILVSGKDDDKYTQDILKNVVLLIDLGGRNCYSGSIAYADENQIRIIIDFGREITINSSESSAGTGILGIGLLYLPNTNGKYKIEGGNFSQGCGVLGVGGIFVHGGTGVFKCEKFGQGAGMFGIGVFQHFNSYDSTYTVKLYGQGAGLTKGIGVFQVDGNKITLEAGLEIPDPREEKAAISLSQGVGYGPRFLAGGGIGIMLLKGNRFEVVSNYISQGCGYWYGLGLFSLIGNENVVKARRYNKGCGLHAAFGAMLLTGNKNRMINWGVAPAYGWDLAIGLCLVNGDDNEFQTDWGSIRGDINGHGLSVIKGNRNKLHFPDYGSGSFARYSPSYGVAIFVGEDTKLYSKISSPDGKLTIMHDPWGIMIGEDIHFDPEMKKTEVEWSSIEREKIDIQKMSSLLKDAEEKETFTKLSTWLSIATSFGVTPNEAIKLLLNISPQELSEIIKLYHILDIYEFKILQLVITSFGDLAIPYLIMALDEEKTFNKRLILLSVFRYLSYSRSIPLLLKYLNDKDWRVRSSVASYLGELLSNEKGANPGRITVLKQILHLLKTADEKGLNEKMLKLLARKNLIDIFGILSLSKNFENDEKIKLYTKNPDLFSPVKSESIALFGNIMFKRRNEYINLIQQELEVATKYKPQVRKELINLLNDNSEKVQASAITSIGRIGNEEDIPHLVIFLNHKSVHLREKTVSSLAKMGKKSYEFLNNYFKKTDEETRKLITTSVFHGWDGYLLKILKMALKDRSPKVKLTALATFSSLDEPLRNKRKKFKNIIRTLKTDPDPIVRINASLISKQIF